MLERGARQCVVFTDRSNPTSNRIFEAVGDKRVAEWEERSFNR